MTKTSVCLPILLVIFAAGCRSTAERKSPITASAQDTMIADIDFLRSYPARPALGLVSAVIEIPAGQSAKWEVSGEDGIMRWERRGDGFRIVRYLPYPAHYGMVPRTVMSASAGGDGDPLDIIVLGPPVERGAVINARIIGGMRLIDEGERDDKLIAVDTAGAFRAVRSIKQLDSSFVGVSEILRNWFTNYKGPGHLSSPGWLTEEHANALVDSAAAWFEEPSD